MSEASDRQTIKTVVEAYERATQRLQTWNGWMKYRGGDVYFRIAYRPLLNGLQDGLKPVIDLSNVVFPPAAQNKGNFTQLLFDLRERTKAPLFAENVVERLHPFLLRAGFEPYDRASYENCFMLYGPLKIEQRQHAHT